MRSISRLISIFFSLLRLRFLALINTPIVSTQTKFSRTKANLFDPILSSNIYTGRIKENEEIVQLTPALHATDSDLNTTPNGLLFDLIFSHLRKQQQSRFI